MISIYDQCMKLLEERGAITYDEAARELKRNASTIGKVYRQAEAARAVTIDKSSFPYVVRQRSASPAKGV